jgi:hypothetical protein
MLVVVQRVDVMPAIVRNEPPVALIRRLSGPDKDPNRTVMMHGQTHETNVWRMADFKVDERGQRVWSSDLGRSPDGLIRVKLFPYDLAESKPETLATLGIQFAALACQLLPDDVSIERLVFVVGNTVTRPDGKDGCRVWLGFAIRLEKET